MFFISYKKIFMGLLLLTACFLCMLQMNTYSQNENIYHPRGFIVLVIDDFGNNHSANNAFFNLDIPLTAAVMPNCPYSSLDAEQAFNSGLEVILHLPLEPEYGDPHWLGTQGITTNLSVSEIKQRVTNALSQVKYAKGINNHMGSKATKNTRVMTAVLEIAEENNLFFLDSKTTTNSCVPSICQELEIACYKRDIFLDNSKDLKDIEKQIDKLAKIAETKGYAIGIGHTGPEGGTITAQAIKNSFPRLKEKGYEFIFLSGLKYIIQ